jgi:hypothetical protein
MERPHGGKTEPSAGRSVPTWELAQLWLSPEPASNGLPTVRGFVKDVSGLYNPTSMVQRVSR